MGPCNSVPCQIVLDKSDYPAVEVKSNLLRWTGAAWTGPAGNSLVALGLNASNQVLSLQDTGTAIQVVALSVEGALTNYVPVLAVPTDIIGPDDTPQVTVDSVGEPVVLWMKSDIHVARWTGADWDQTYGVLTPAQGKAAIALIKGSIPIVAWEDKYTSPISTHVAKSNH